MKTLPIINRLCQSVPRQVSYFADEKTISALSQSAGVATATTATPHGMVAGNFGTIVGAKAVISITSLTQTGGVATAVLSQAHNLTMGYNLTVEISGVAQAGYNGQKTLLSIDSPTQIKFQVDAATVSPATGSPVYLDPDTEYNGVHEVLSTPSTTQITYAVASTTPPTAAGTIKAAHGYRIAGALSLEEALNDYTQRGATSSLMWMFVLVGPSRANKDRNTTIDAIGYSSGSADVRQIIIQPLNILVFVPRKNEVGGVAARDKIEDVRPALIRAMCGVNWQTGMTNGQGSRTAYVGDALISANNDKIVWAFDFEATYDIIQDDTAIADVVSVPFRLATLNTHGSPAITVTDAEIPR